ncbi:CNDP dipeptidase [Rhizoctonia solani]|uniref:CNDP dipeptidase n=1 Tax=Rhizoctonia solani TaxID=456999 RepID=A0A8H7I6M1_9AGAM|nr:CNDP dipeptidase [Rhizoctonia solani]KAF8749841.1 CNDP dipeptidase [Rhizoctonia solani]
MTAAPKEFFDYVDAHKDAFIKRLSNAIAIPRSVAPSRGILSGQPIAVHSVSGDASYRKHVHEMGHFVQRELEAVGVTTKLVPLGPQELDGQTVELPPVVFGRLGEDKNKKTVLIYAHYDVQPALLSDGWTHDPFVLTHDKETDRLYGRGSSDDKGPLLGWINVLEAHKALGIELPVNLRVCFEGMEESGSEGLDDLIKAEAGPGKFFDGVDCVCISDNYWLNDVTPCLTYGLRGISYFKVTISGPAKDLHSGLFGNCVHEPMTDLFHLFSKLVTPQGKILIPGINDLVDELTPEERERYERMDYSIADINESVGASIAISDDKAEVLMGKMRYPSLSIHGIEGAFSAAGAKTVIPAKISGEYAKRSSPRNKAHHAAGKFSIRLVPSMTPENVDSLVIQYLESEFAKLNSKSKLTVENLHGGKPYLADPNHWNFVAAAKATQAIYGKQPDLTREGGSIPVTLTFADALGVSVLLLPMGRGSDGAHSTNEKLDLSNYINGTKVLGTYLHEIAKSTN